MQFFLNEKLFKLPCDCDCKIFAMNAFFSICIHSFFECVSFSVCLEIIFYFLPRKPHSRASVTCRYNAYVLAYATPIFSDIVNCIEIIVIIVTTTNIFIVILFGVIKIYSSFSFSTIDRGMSSLYSPRL